MGKKRVSIYIDEGVWDSIKEEAWRLRTSASALLEQIACGDRPVVPLFDTGLMLANRDSVESVVDLETEKSKKIAELKANLSDNDRYQSVQKINPQPKAKWKGK